MLADSNVNFQATWFSVFVHGQKYAIGSFCMLQRYIVSWEKLWKFSQQIIFSFDKECDLSVYSQ